MTRIIALASFVSLPALVAGMTAAQSDGCNQSVPTSQCLPWAPLTGDPGRDKCLVSKLDEAALLSAYDPGRLRTIADGPMPSRDVMLARLKDAAGRVVRDCMGADDK